MLTEERNELIVEHVNRFKQATVSELSNLLMVSEATIRRDLTALASMGKIKKVHGGAIPISSFQNNTANEKEKKFKYEKESIAKYAASTIRPNDFIFIDAGSTTYKMLDYITEPDATFITNGFRHARMLASKNFNVYIIGGRLKAAAEAVIGTECIDALKKYNFTKCYMGTNGISLSAGLTTPDTDEANVKKTVIEQSYVSYILADHSKFNIVSSVTFAPAEKVCIITDRLPDSKFSKTCIIKETEK
ncbi:MAG: DeoR/GlpR family DNA-binding transcription regulator [Clostridium sp.]|nr:DeoR/GlpR family DNA-binding transcription regulator [Clostridium sp.]MCM1547348.1 DeoR/GlpR family DNA-binding transcription regulator [Ruminococcus sp.]